MAHLLDSIVLVQDLPGEGLKAGDMGTIVEFLSETDAMVEFVLASGRTQALVLLGGSQFRLVGDHDLVAVRTVDAASV